MPPPFRIEGLDHVLLLVSDMARATAFYVEALGCTVESRTPQYGMIQFRAGASTLDLVDIGAEEGAWARPETSGGRNLDHLCLAITAEAEALRRHLAQHGVPIVEETLHADAGVACLSVYVRDPDGNQIELKLPPAPAQR